MDLRDARRVARLRGLAKRGEAKRIRVESGLSLHEMSSVIGTDAGTLSRWEDGAHQPRAQLALRWLDALVKLKADLEEMAS